MAKKSTGRRPKRKATKKRSYSRRKKTEEQQRWDSIREAVKKNHELRADFDAQAVSHLVNSSELLNADGTSNHKDVIRQARRIYKGVGVVHNVVDLMADFAIQGICLVHEEEEQEMFYNAWTKKVDIFGRGLHFLSSLFKDGNNVVFRHRATLKEEDVEELRALGDAFRGLKRSKPNVIPVRYTFLDPVKTEKIGSELFGQQYEVEFSRVERKALTKPETKEEREFIKQLPKQALENIRKSGKVTLTKEEVFVSHYKKDDWEEWGEPIFFSIFDDIKFKDILRKMDESVARNIMNSIVIFRLGDTKNQLPATTKEIATFADLLKTPTKSKTLVWNDLVDFIATYPETNLMLNDDKYKAVNNDILSGLGVSEVLINGLGGNYANSFLSVKTLLEKLESARKIFEKWLRTELELIRTAMGWEKLPKIKFGHMTLRDERAEKALILNLLDKGIISNQTALSYFGEDWKVEIKRIRQEQKDIRGLRKPNNTKRPGRPVNTDDIPQDNKRETKPTGSSLQSVINSVRLAVMENKGLTDETGLTEDDNEKIKILSEEIMPYLSDPFNTDTEEVSRIISEVIYHG